MKLEKYRKNKKLKTSLVLSIIIGILVVGSVFLYKTYAYYQNNKEYNVIKGVVPDFGYDVKLAIIVDGQEATKIPNGPEGKEGKYYEVEVSCPDSETAGSWDYNAWKLNLDFIEADSKCTLKFTSNLTKDDYNKYIEAGVATRRNTYRGKDITYLKDSGDLYSQIDSCKFDDIYVGDYIESKTQDSSGKNIIWLIADLNNYRYSGDQGNGLVKCHATIIPAKPLKYDQMNPTNTSDGGYYGSNMVTNILGTVIDESKDDILNKYIVPDFKDHLISYRNLLSKTVDGGRVNRYGILTKNEAGVVTGGIGASSDWGWYDRYLDLMSEVNVYGSVVWSSSGYDIGIDNRQYAIFNLKPEFINSYGTERFHYWLKAVTNSASFASVGGSGHAGSYGASYSNGVRPRFLIGQP